MSAQSKKLRRYIIPSMISNVAFFILTIVDGMFVGNGVGTDALGAVSLSMPYVMIGSAVSVLFTIGGVSVAAIRLGRGDDMGANQVFMHSLTGVISVFAILTFVGTLFSDQVAILLGANETYHDMVSTYVFWYSLFFIPAGLFTCLSNFCRNDGEPQLSSIACVVCMGFNIFGDWLLVFPLQKGIAGAAFATGASQLFAVGI